MLLKYYRKRIFQSHCNPSAMTLHCHAELEQDVSAVLPYLNASLGGDFYTVQPPSVTFRTSGKLITVHSTMIAINALKDEREADKILKWLQREINYAWENRQFSTPCYCGTPKPQMIEILKKLPMTNCRKCREPTCMVFAIRVTAGAKSSEQCPDLDIEERKAIQAYMAQFNLDI